MRKKKGKGKGKGECEERARTKGKEKARDSERRRERYQGFPCLFIECCFHAYFWCAFSLRRLRLTQGRQDTPSPKYENNIP